VANLNRAATDSSRFKRSPPTGIIRTSASSTSASTEQVVMSLRPGLRKHRLGSTSTASPTHMNSYPGRTARCLPTCSSIRWRTLSGRQARRRRYPGRSPEGQRRNLFFRQWLRHVARRPAARVRFRSHDARIRAAPGSPAYRLKHRDQPSRRPARSRFRARRRHANPDVLPRIAPLEQAAE